MYKDEFGFENHEEEELRCPVCSYFFSEKKQPYLLTCSHNLCQDCIEEIAKKNLWFCPLCKHDFSKHDKKNFKVNLSFKNIVIKILKTKMIYCLTCKGIFSFSEHSRKCDEINFRETSSIYDEIKQTAEKCFEIIKTNKNQSVIDLAKSRINKQINCIWGDINTEFLESYHSALDSFLKEFPIKELNNCFGSISNFVRLYMPVSNLLGRSFNDDTFIYRNQTMFFDELEDERSVGELSDDPETKERLVSKLPIKVMHGMSEVKASPRSKSPIVIRKKEPMSELKRKQSVQHSMTSSIMESPKLLLDELFKNFNDVKFKLNKFETYSEQINFFIESLKTQIFDNFSLVENNLKNNITSIFDGICVNFKNTYRRYLLYIIDGSKKFSLYSVANRSVSTYEVEALKFNFMKLAQTVVFDESEKVYIAGGFKREVTMLKIKEEVSDGLTIYSIKENKVLKVVKMPKPRAFHSCLVVQNKMYLIGGIIANEEYVKACDCLNLESTSWEYIPKLNYDRLYPSLCVVNQKFLFAFTGITTRNDATSIESLNLVDRKKWQSIEPSDPGRCWTKPSLCGVAVINEKEILICGGKSSGTVLYSTFIYNPMEKYIYRSKDMKLGGAFNNCTAHFNRKLTMIDERGNGTTYHEFDLENETWTVL